MVPVDSFAFQNFIEKSNLFEKTHTSMMNCLTYWYQDEPKNFINDMRADLRTVLDTYHFYNAGVSISKNYSYTPPLDYISCYIRITDDEDDYCAEYTTFFDYGLNIFDDKLCK